MGYVPSVKNIAVEMLFVCSLAWGNPPQDANLWIPRTFYMVENYQSTSLEGEEARKGFSRSLGEGKVISSKSFYVLPQSYEDGDPTEIRAKIRGRVRSSFNRFRVERDPRQIRLTADVFASGLNPLVSQRIPAKVGASVLSLFGWAVGFPGCAALLGGFVILHTARATRHNFEMRKNERATYQIRALRFFAAVSEEMRFFTAKRIPSPHFQGGRVIWNFLDSSLGNLDFGFGYLDGQPVFLALLNDLF
jgi:hypothetical protein